MAPELLPRAILDAGVGFPVSFFDMIGFILASSDPPPAPRITIFHNIWKLLLRAILDAGVGVPALFLDMVGLILASSTPRQPRG